MVASPWFALALMLAVGMAGCAGDGASQDSAPLAEPRPTADLGSVQGIVVDDEGFPVGGAMLALPDAGLETVSEADSGAFLFNGLQTGAHVLYAQRLGYESAVTRFDVVAGQTATLHMVMKPIRVAGPYLQLEEHTGHIDLAERYETPVGSEGRVFDLGTLDFFYEWDFDLPPAELSQMFIEMEWTGTQMLAGGMRLRVETEDGTNNLARTFCVLEGESPVTCQVEKETIDDAVDASSDCDEDDCTAHWRAFTGVKRTGLPAEFGLMYDQDFTVYVSHFYNQPMPAGYSARPDA